MKLVISYKNSVTFICDGTRRQKCYQIKGSFCMGPILSNVSNYIFEFRQKNILTKNREVFWAQGKLGFYSDFGGHIGGRSGLGGYFGSFIAHLHF